MKTILIVDASCYFYRAFFGAPQDPAGGLRAMMRNALDYHQPDAYVVALDAGRETFRNQIYPHYKGNRKETPEGFPEALKAMLEEFEKLGFRRYSCAGYEADDVIGTMCEKLDSYQRIILSKDKDLMQLIRECVSMWQDANYIEGQGYTGKWVGPTGVFEKFGVSPEQIPDLLALVGDSSDNIPGVAGVGQKTASALIADNVDLYQLYENLRANVGQFKPKVKAQLWAGRESAFISLQLATINTNVPIDLSDM